MQDTKTYFTEIHRNAILQNEGENGKMNMNTVPVQLSYIFDHYNST